MLRHVGKFIVFIVVLMVAVAVLLAIMSIAGPDRLKWLQSVMDSRWLAASMVRWIVLAGIIYWMPSFLSKKAEQFKQLSLEIVDEYDEAQDNNATYETLVDIEQRHASVVKMHNSYAKMYEQRVWISCLLITFEILAVQVPHYL